MRRLHLVATFAGALMCLSSGLAQAGSRAQAVAHSFFAFERVVVRGGKLRRQTRTRGMESVKATPEVMIAKIFGPGALELPERLGEVWWAQANGPRRLLGRMESLAGETVFVPTNAARRTRNRVLGELLTASLSQKFRSASNHGLWLDPRFQSLPGGGRQIRYQPMRQRAHGQTGPTSDGMLASVAGRTNDRDLSLALEPRQGVIGGGLPLRYSLPARGGARERVRAVFYPDGVGPSPRPSQFERDALRHFRIAQGGGATVERELVAQGESPKRAISRREMNGLFGYIRDQQKRWAFLARERSPIVGFETAIAEHIWRIGGMSWSDLRPLPRVTAEAPPNLMLSVLFGPGKTQIEGGVVSFRPATGGRVLLGRMGRAGFQPSSAVLARRNAYLGEAILDRVLSEEKTRKGYGFDKDTTFPRFPRALVKTSASTVEVEGYYSRVPRAQTIEIQDRVISVIETAGHALPKAIEGVLSPRSDGIPVALSWRSHELTLPGDHGGRRVRVPAGSVAVHEMSLFKAPQSGRHVIRYGYEIVPE